MTIASALDKLNDKLAGSDQPASQTIEGMILRLIDNIDAGGGGSLPIASADTLGGIKVGENLSITEGGVLSASGGGGGALFIQTEYDEDLDALVPVGITYDEVVASLSETTVILIAFNKYLSFGGYQIDEEYEPTDKLVFYGFQYQWDSIHSAATTEIVYTVWNPDEPGFFINGLPLSS